LVVGAPEKYPAVNRPHFAARYAAMNFGHKVRDSNPQSDVELSSDVGLSGTL